MLSAKRISLLFVLLLMLIPATQAQDTSSLPLLQNGDTINASMPDNGALLYVFNGTQSDFVTITMTQSSDTLDPLLILLGPSGQLVALDDDNGEIQAAARIQTNLPENGTYFLVATEAFAVNGESFFPPNDAAGFTLTLTGNTQPATIPDGQGLYFADILEPGIRYQGTISNIEPVFYWTFQGRAGDVVNITATSDELDMLLYVFGRKGERIAVNDDDELGSVIGDSAVRQLRLPTDDTYYVFATVFSFTSLVSAFQSFEGGSFIISLTQSNTPTE